MPYSPRIVLEKAILPLNTPTLLGMIVRSKWFTTWKKLNKRAHSSVESCLECSAFPGYCGDWPCLVSFCWCYYRYLQLEPKFSVSLMCFLWKGWDIVSETCSKLLSLSLPGDKLQLKNFIKPTQSHSSRRAGTPLWCAPPWTLTVLVQKGFCSVLRLHHVADTCWLCCVNSVLLCELKFAVHCAAGVHLGLFKCGLYNNFILILNKLPILLRFWNYAT